MSERKAACCCGSLHVTCEGEPARIGMCHCTECQRRTGSIFGVQARFHKDQVTVEGPSAVYERRGDEGILIRFHFCRTCGTTLYWVMDVDPDLIAVAVGAFADASFPPPAYSVYEARRHPWSAMPDLKIDLYD